MINTICVLLKKNVKSKRIGKKGITGKMEWEREKEREKKGLNTFMKWENELFSYNIKFSQVM